MHTHIIVSTLRFLKSESYYFEKNESEDLHNFIGLSDHFRERDGICYYRHFAGIPKYGTGISIPEPTSGNMIYDFGKLTDYYGTEAEMAWTIEKGSSLKVLNKFY